MSTRSPQNKRTQAQLQGERTGMARKSTSSAKPARPAAGSVRVVASSGKAKRQELERGEDLSGLSREEKKARKQQRRMQEDRVYTASQALMKEDYDYNRFRRIFWVLLGVSMVCIVLLWVALYALRDAGEFASIAQLAGVVLVYAFLIASFIFDFVKIRPIRNKYRAVAEGLSDAKLNAVIEKSAADEDRKRAVKEAKKAAKKK